MQLLTIPISADRGPLYMQIYRHIAAGISCGRIPAGEKLPSKRRLARHLGLSVNTVDGAYQSLASEGYIESRPRSGFVVAEMPVGMGAPTSPRWTSTQRPQPAPTAKPTPPKYDLRSGAVDSEAFPFATWAKLTKKVMMRGSSLLRPGEAQGEMVLRKALARHLQESRGISIPPERLVIGAGMEYLLPILANLTGRDTLYALEDPGYVKTRRILDNTGVGYAPIAMDASGMRIDMLHNSGAKVACITPTHQFPMGITMPVARRLELVAWAGAAPGRYIVEDDYDSEFRYSGRPVPPLAGLTASDRIIYIGTMSRSIAPSVRIAYMALPERLLAIYGRRFAPYSCTVSVFEQNTLAEFITGGHLVRHLNRMRTLGRRRRDALIASLESAFGNRIVISGASVGLHLLISLADGPGEAVMKASAAAAGISLSGVSEYACSRRTAVPANTVVAGYAATKEDDMPDVARLLYSAWGGKPEKRKPKARNRRVAGS